PRARLLGGVLLGLGDPAAAYDQLQDHGVTFLPGVPTMHGAFLSVARARREAGAEPADFSRLRMPLSGGASLPVETLHAAEKLYGVPVLEGYGLSEKAGACFFNPVDAPTRPGTVGRPVDGFEFRIVAMDGTEVPEEDHETSSELAHPGRGHHGRLLGPPGGHGGGVRRGRLVPHRGHRPPGRGRVRDDRGPAQGRDHPRRHERVPPRGGGGPLRAPGRGRGRRGGCVRRAAGRGDRRLRLAGPGQRRHGGAAPGVRGRASGPLQAAAGGDRPGRTAEERHGQDPAPRAASGVRGAGRSGRRSSGLSERNDGQMTSRYAPGMTQPLAHPPKAQPGERIAVVSPSFAAPGFAPAVHEQAMRRL
ncbi:hypothetical protein E4A41_05495, partial [Micrococcus endophyticus]